MLLKRVQVFTVVAFSCVFARAASADQNIDRIPDLSVPENTYGVYRDQYGAYRDSSMLPDNLEVPIIDHRRYSFKHNVAPKPNSDIVSGSSQIGGGMGGGMGGRSMSGGGGMSGGMSGGGMMSGGMSGGGMSGGGMGGGGMGGGGMGGGGMGGPPGGGPQKHDDGRWSETGSVFGLFDVKGQLQSAAIIGPNNSMVTLSAPPSAAAARPPMPHPAVMPDRAFAQRMPAMFDDEDPYTQPMMGRYGHYRPNMTMSRRTVHTSGKFFNPLAHLAVPSPAPRPVLTVQGKIKTRQSTPAALHPPIPADPAWYNPKPLASNPDWLKM